MSDLTAPGPGPTHGWSGADARTDEDLNAQLDADMAEALDADRDPVDAARHEDAEPDEGWVI